MKKNSEGSAKKRRKKQELQAERDEAEIIAYVKSVLRGEPDEDGRSADIKSRLKAAEFLAKRYGLLSEKKTAPETELLVHFDYGEDSDEDSTGRLQPGV